VQWNHVLGEAVGGTRGGAGGGAMAGAPSTSDDDSGCGIEEFAWVPAGLTPAQVSSLASTSSSS